MALRISEDLESFEATTEIEVTSPARPWLGAVQLADDGDLDWECDYRAAFHGDIAALADVIAAILHASPGTRLRGIPARRERLVITAAGKAQASACRKCRRCRRMTFPPRPANRAR